MSSVVRKLPPRAPGVAARRARHRVITPAVLGVGALVAVALLAPGLVAVSVAVAAGILLAFTIVGVGAAVMVRRASRRVLSQYPHLQRLGRRFDRRFDNARVTSVDEDVAGQLTLQLAWQQQYTTELDDQGVPEGSSSEGPGALSWFIPAQPETSLHRAMLMDLPYRDVTLVEQGRILPQGPVVVTRELIADNGIVVQATAPVLS